MSVNRYIVELEGSFNSIDQRAALFAVGGRIDYEFSDRRGDGYVAAIVTDGRLGANQVIQYLSRIPGVISVEQDQTLSILATSNDPGFTSGALWGMDGDLSTPSNSFGTQAAEVWQLGATGSMKTVIGVVDSGIDYRHVDLYLNIWLNWKEIPTSFRSSLVDTDGDALITFRDLNAPTNGAYVTDVNSNGYIDAGDLLNDVRWEDRSDTDGNGFIDDLVGWDFANNDNNPFDDNGHGTHVAGTIGAIGGNGTGVAGINWQVQMVPIKFLTSTGSGLTSAATGAVNYFTALSVANYTTHNFVGTNNSWGGTTSSAALQAAITDAARQDLLFIAAAGNASTNNNFQAHYPSNYSTRSAAGYEAVIAVASITSNGGLSSFSNYGATTVDLGAPGSSIYSTLANGTYGTLSGTSMATPHVTGAAALIASAFPNMTSSQIATALLNNTTTTSSLSGRALTNGRLDIGKVFDVLGYATQPVFSVQSITLSDPTLRLGETLTVVLTFTQNVSGLELSDFTFDISNGVLTNLQQNPGNALQWTVLFTPNANITDTTNSIGLRAGSYTDTSNTPTPGPAATTANFVIDNVGPSVTGFVLPGNALAGGTPVTLAIDFSEAVINLSLSDFAWDANVGTLSNLLQGSNTHWTLSYTPLNNITVASSTISLNASSYTDLAGNAGQAATTASFSVAPPADTTSPTIVSMAIAPTSLRSGQTAALTIVFSEEVSGFDVTDLVYDGANGSIANLVRSPTDAKVWTAVFTPNANVTDATNTVGIVGGTYTDSSNLAGDAGVSGNFAIDTQAPSVVSMSLSPSGTLTGGTATLSVTFSEAVSGLSLTDFAVNASHGSLSSLSRIGSTNEWRATYTPLPGVNVLNESITLTDGAFTDAAGNAGVGLGVAPFAINTPTVIPKIIGTASGDTLVGTASSEIFIAVPISGSSIGARTIDRLTGNGGNDKFIMGDSRGLFYNDGLATNTGGGDYALVTDFSAGDKVLLSNSYSYLRLSAMISGISSTAIIADIDRNGRYSTSDEIIGALQNVLPSSLTMNSEVLDGYNYIVIA